MKRYGEEQDICKEKTTPTLLKVHRLESSGNQEKKQARGNTERNERQGFRERWEIVE